MHDALDRRQRVVADRVGAFVRRGDQFRRVGDELAADRVVRRLDQRAHGRRDGDGVARSTAAISATRVRADQPGGGEVLSGAKNTRLQRLSDGPDGTGLGPLGSVGAPGNSRSAPVPVLRMQLEIICCCP